MIEAFEYGAQFRLAWTAMREDQITFTATIQQSDDDAKFGFFKRPTKASVV